jgi:hypothetical protein
VSFREREETGDRATATLPHIRPLVIQLAMSVRSARDGASAVEKSAARRTRTDGRDDEAEAEEPRQIASGR